MAAKKIAILVAENDPYPVARGHFIWELCDLWRAWGHEIAVLKGIQNLAAADLLIPHVDVTVLPQAYLDFFQKYPRVANRRVRDISKRWISRNLLSREDAYDGPVIVKTDLNSGGVPEVHFQREKIFFSTKRETTFWRNWLNLAKDKSPRGWREINCMDSTNYQVFPSLKAVPKAVFENESLVVERFHPEFEDGIYHLRVYVFFGDQGYAVRVGSPQPIVKQANIISREEVSIPDEVLAVRHELGMDYGKLDFVIHEGRPIVFDVNRTPGLIKPEDRMKASALKLAPGINSLF